MSYYVRLAGYQPPPRDDGVKWITARIEESVGARGPWETIDEQAVADYPDADDPPLLNFTTDDAELEAGWYRIVWIDPVGTEAPTEAAGQSGAGLLLPPSALAVRERSPLLKRLYPEAPLDGEVEAALRETVGDAVSLVEARTCRTLNDDLPDELHRIAVRAVTLKAQQIGTSQAADHAEQVAAGRLLRGFTAGPYSETYFAPGELGVKGGRPRVDPNDALDEALWALMTPECREAFIAEATGVQPPAGVLQEFDYRRQGRRGGRGMAPQTLGSGPDGW